MALAFKVSEEAVRLWTIHDGLPCLRRGSPGVEGRYPLPECVAWLVERERKKEADNPSGRRAEWLATKIQREQLALARETGELVSVASVQKSAFQTARVLRDNLLLIPDRLAPQLAAETDVAGIYTLLDTHIRQVLEALAVELAAPLIESNAG